LKDIEDVKNLIEETINDYLNRLQAWSPLVNTESYWTAYTSSKYGLF